jgi:acetoin utilization deacetylase AcuC-like enzyme
MLEGGYDYKALADSVFKHINVLATGLEEESL